MRTKRSKSAFFVATQVLFALAVAGVAAYGFRSARRTPALPAYSRSPLNIRPLYNDSRVVGDTQLRDVLVKLRPPPIADFPKVNHIDHALRFWGVDARFVGGNHANGEQMRRFLVDDAYFRSAGGGKVRSLMRSRDTGISFRTQEGRNTSSHTDHTLSTLAEAGTALTYPIQTPAGPLQLDAALRHALRTFSIDQPEYEWSIITFALYRVNDANWHSAEGDRITWDRIARRLMRQRMGQGCCYGGHRLYTLTVLLRIDTDRMMFTADVREQIENHLGEATQRLVANQSTAGWMDGAWPGEVINKADKLGPLAARLLSTGHALEWWAIAPEDLQPPRESVVRAGRWLSNEILKMDEQTVRKNYTFLTHAGRALVLWRGQLPAEFEEQIALLRPDDIAN